MPIYEYRCQQGHTFEVMQRMSDDPLVSCQTCEAPVQRVFHPVAVHFKGSGFYNTDYGTRKRAREKSEASEGGGGSEGSKSSDSSSGSDTKTDTKADKKPAASSSSSSSETKKSG
jgi:putative FmdB family regulatory protein